MNTFREGTIYVSKRTLRRLKWVKASKPPLYTKNLSTGEISPLVERPITLDEFADIFLNECLEEKFPGLIPAEKLYNQAEDQAIQTVKDTK